MTERRWYQLHRTTTAALVIVAVCLAWCDFVGSSRTLKYLFLGTRSFGWPLEHFDGRRDFSAARSLANLLAGICLLVGIAAALEPPRRIPARRAGLRLTTLLSIIAVVAVLLALTRSEVEWPEHRPTLRSELELFGHWARGELDLPDHPPLGRTYVPISWYPLPVRFGILAGLGCALFAAVRWSLRLVRRLVPVTKSGR